MFSARFVSAHVGIILGGAARHARNGVITRRLDRGCERKSPKIKSIGCRSGRLSFDARCREFKKEKSTMRCLVMVKANKDSEAGVMPSKELLTEMGKFNEELVKAGVLLAAEGLQASSKGKRVRFSGSKRSVIDGPFTETKELVAGFWLWQVRSMEEAIEWLKRAPFDGGTEVEIRQVFEADDFGANLTPELKEQEEQLRKKVSAKK